MIGNVLAAELLLEHGAYVDILNRAQETPLLLAVLARREDVARVFLRFDADPDMESSERRSPLSVAKSAQLTDLLFMMNQLLKGRESGDKPSWITRSKSKGIYLKESKKKQKLKETDTEQPLRDMLGELLQMNPKSKKLNATVEHFIERLVRYYYHTNTAVPPDSCNWGAIMYHLMLITKDVLSASEVKLLRAALEEYLVRSIQSQSHITSSTLHPAKSSTSFSLSSTRYAAPFSSPNSVRPAISMPSASVSSISSGASGSPASAAGVASSGQSAASSDPQAPVSGVSWPQQYCRDLLEYLVTHDMDPNNSLVGLRGKEAVIHSMTIPLSEMFFAFRQVEHVMTVYKPKPQPQRSSAATIRSYPAISEASIDSLMKWWLQAHGVEGMYARIGRQAVALSRLKEAHADMCQVWEGRTLRPGDLVIAIAEKHSELSFVYYRYTGRRRGEYLQLYTDADENSVIEVHQWLMAPLPEHALAHLGNKKTMEQIVDGPLESLYALVDKHSREVMSSTLEKNGITREVQRMGMFMSSLSLSDGKRLKEGYERMQELAKSKEELFEQIVRDTRRYIHELYRDRMDSMVSLYSMFAPTRNDSIAGLLDIPVLQLFSQRFDRVLRSCRNALKQYERMRDNIISGREKRQITDWWLTCISEHLQAFLNNIGFVENALPQSYLEEAPKDSRVVQENFRLLEEVLDFENDPHNVKVLVEEVQSDVYPIIKQYIENAQAVITDLLSLSKTRFSVRLTRTMLQRSSSALSGEETAVVRELVADLEYLMAAQELDDAYRGEAVTQAKGPMSHIVPISGLVISGIYRRHNAHKTAMEVWKIRPLRTSSSSMAEMAVQRLSEGACTSRNQSFRKSLQLSPGDVPGDVEGESKQSDCAETSREDVPVIVEPAGCVGLDEGEITAGDGQWLSTSPAPDTRRTTGLLGVGMRPVSQSSVRRKSRARGSIRIDTAEEIVEGGALPADDENGVGDESGPREEPTTSSAEEGDTANAQDRDPVGDKRMGGAIDMMDQEGDGIEISNGDDPQESRGFQCDLSDQSRPPKRPERPPRLTPVSLPEASDSSGCSVADDGSGNPELDTQQSENERASQSEADAQLKEKDMRPAES
eukprot:TRINITY_DN9754_c0_g1_i2.p1 TRINITY_DN9754_c0_g1~~TRINITY_DN9754_c0_g1_i2.p1  ORF type:complete len:1228 (+),score=289.37 TRINITY_DN9754_c0_g1_i2:366-3686(+)